MTKFPLKYHFFFWSDVGAGHIFHKNDLANLIFFFFEVLYFVTWLVKGKNLLIFGWKYDFCMTYMRLVQPGRDPVFLNKINVLEFPYCRYGAFENDHPLYAFFGVQS